jgi:hypothetical protein
MRGIVDDHIESVRRVIFAQVPHERRISLVALNDVNAIAELKVQRRGEVHADNRGERESIPPHLQ